MTKAGIGAGAEEPRARDSPEPDITYSDYYRGGRVGNPAMIVAMTIGPSIATQCASHKHSPHSKVDSGSETSL